MINRMPAGDVCIELNDEGQAKISGGVAEFEIPALNASDYPSLPVTGADNTMTVKCGMLREMIEKTIYAVSQDDKKPAHTGELFVIEPGSLTIVALTATVWPSSSAMLSVPAISASSSPPRRCRNC